MSDQEKIDNLIWQNEILLDENKKLKTQLAKYTNPDRNKKYRERVKNNLTSSKT